MVEVLAVWAGGGGRPWRRKDNHQCYSLPDQKLKGYGEVSVLTGQGGVGRHTGLAGRAVGQRHHVGDDRVHLGGVVGLGGGWRGGRQQS